MDDVKYFPYGEKSSLIYGKKDKKLSAVINRVGHIERAVDDDLFFRRGTPHHRGATDFHKGAGNRLVARAERPSARSMPNTFWAMAKQICSRSAFRSAKAEYITDFAKKVHTGEFDLISIGEKPDEEVILELSALKGIGVGQRKCCFYSACSARMCSATATSPFARHAHGLPPQGDRPRTVRAAPQTFFAVLQHRKLIFLGGLRRRAPPNSPTPPRRNRRNKRTFFARIEKIVFQSVCFA